MPRSVVCGVDHSVLAHAVVEAAATLAQALDARLLLVHSRQAKSMPLGRAAPHPGFPGWAPPDPRAEEPAEDLLRRLASCAGPALSEVVLVEDSPSRALCRIARAAGASLLVVGSRARGTLGTLLMGSVSGDVVRRAPCPVMVIPDAALGDVERPLVDGSTVVCGVASPEDRRPAALAGTLASALGLRIRLTHVLAPVQHAVIPSTAGIVPTLLEAPPPSRTGDAVDLLEHVLDDILAAHPDLVRSSDWCVRTGDARMELAEMAIRSHAAAIVVGSGGHGPIGGALVNSPARTLARAATVPVVVCRDDHEPLL